MRKSAFVVLGTALALSCILPEEPCACLVYIEAGARGSVTSAAGAPVAGAVVRAYAQAAACPLVSGYAWPFPDSATTNAAGEYQLVGYGSPPASRFCLRVVARAPAPALDSVVFEGMKTRADEISDQPGVFRVDLVLP